MMFSSPDWQAKAACRNQDPTVFFPDEGDDEATIAAKEAAAKCVCWDCPVRRDCLEFAVVTNQKYGIWGAANEQERQRIRRSRRFGNPLADQRKAEASRLVGMGADVDEIEAKLGVSHRQAFRLHSAAKSTNDLVAAS